MENITTIKVIKRNGKKVPFNIAKLTIGIKNAFYNTDFSEEKSDSELNLAANEIVSKVIDKITSEILIEDTITVQNLSELTERVLQESGYLEVYNTYANYRQHRESSRQAFSNEKKMHKFLKSLEELSLKDAASVDAKRENANIDGNTSMGTMLQYGSTISKEFAKSYLMKPKFSEAHDEGAIHIHDLDFEAMGTTTCNQIDLEKLFKGGFNTGHGYLREPNSIISYAALAAIAIQSDQNDQHGGQAVPALDYFLAPGVLKTFKKEYYKQILNLLEFDDFSEFINMEKLKKKIDNLTSISFNIEEFNDFYKNNDTLFKIFKFAYKKSLENTDRQTYQGMEAFIHNLNSMHSRAGSQVPFSSVSFGTDISPEGRMVTKNFLLAEDAGLGRGETPIFPVSIFKVKEGINYNPEDINYDLFELSCKVSAKRLFPNFSFIDAPFNLKFYKEGDWKTEVAYMGCAHKDEIITYIYQNEIIVESFGRAYKRLSDFFEEKEYGISKYLETDGQVKIYDTNNGFVNCKKFIKNPNKDNWYEISLKDGRILTLTADHPLSTINGRKYVKDLHIGDRVNVTYNQYQSELINKSVDKAWFSGYKIQITGYIPSEVFNYCKKAKISFLAGAMDCFGSNISTDTENYIQFTSNRKEIILQIMALVQSLGYPAFIIKGAEDLEYKVRFALIPEMVEYSKKKNKFKNLTVTEYAIPDNSAITEIKPIYIKEESYDVETESDMFELSGVVSHNCRTRVMSDITDPNNETTGGRGNLSFTSINLPRIAIKHGIALGERKKADMDGFYKELDETLELVKDQLLERFKIQCSKHKYNFPFLLGQGLWNGGDKLKNSDNLRKVLKHGSMTFGFIGLAETLTALIGEHHGESEKAQKLGLEIVKHIRDKADEYSEKYQLNFAVIATPAEGLSGRFVNIDKAIYGEIPGVTDKDYYTNSFHIPVKYKISAFKKIKLEAPYHELTNGGHITYVELDGDLTKNQEAFMKIIRYMKESGIGYGAINHPVDRDPQCGFNGIIGDNCPQCGREESEDEPFNRIRRVTGYLTEDVRKFNNAKRSEERDRVKHFVDRDTQN
jgi:anaerobic ribonucleoside-triphosphate reductase